jgi:hypothetical protein
MSARALASETFPYIYPRQCLLIETRILDPPSAHPFSKELEFEAGDLVIAALASNRASSSVG